MAVKYKWMNYASLETSECSEEAVLVKFNDVPVMCGIIMKETPECLFISFAMTSNLDIRVLLKVANNFKELFKDFKWVAHVDKRFPVCIKFAEKFNLQPKFDILLKDENLVQMEKD